MEEQNIENTPPSREQKRIEREREKIRARRENRATYDLPPVLRERVRQLAEEQRIPASQIVTLALARFFQDYSAGEVDLNEYKRPSRSPRYDWNLALPAKLLPASTRRRKTSKDRGSIS